MKMLAALWMSGVLFVQAQDPEYFPLVPDSEYRYKGRFAGKEFDDTLILKTVEVRGKKGYYFENKAQLDHKTLTPPMFGLGLITSEHKHIRTIDVIFRDKLPGMDLTKAQPLLDLPPKTGAKTEVSAGKKRMTITVAGQEDVEVPAGLFKECAKVQVDVAWEGKDGLQTGFVWLAPGVGIVKCHRSTGRVDELVSTTVKK